MIEEIIQKAKKGDPEAQLQLSEYYSFGDYVEEDEEQALFWLEKALEKNYPPAFTSYGQATRLGHYGLPEDEERGNSFCLKAAELGDPHGQLDIGSTYLHGSHGVEKDTELGFFWISKSAKQNQPRAQRLLGEIYLGLKDVKVVKKDNKLAIHWLTLAKEQYSELTTTDHSKGYEFLKEDAEWQLKEVNELIDLANK